MTVAVQQPILASDKISDVLKHHPELLDTLVALSPAFAKLRNPALRRVQSRLVTVAQAAGMAGIQPALLTQKLNSAAGITRPMTDVPTSAEPASSDGPPAWMGQVRIVNELDTRPLMDRGEEPFRQIMSAAASVPAGSAFRLIAGFEPLPLYDVLAKQGFAHSTRRQADDHWEVTFYREHPAAVRPVQEDAANAQNFVAVDWNAPPSAEVTIDVSELVPPEPMIKILETLETLPVDARLLVHHVRRPIHLYDRLDEIGYAHETRDLGPGKIEVLIQKRQSTAP
jgi:uncharacterized protein (DUF2249 family)